MSVKIRNLSYIYSRKTPFEKLALDKLSLDINDGEFFGIIGHTGSGKSTLVSHLNALTRVQDWSNVLAWKNKRAKADELTELVVCGIDLTAKKPDLKSLRTKVGMVFQYPEHQLFADTVLADVCFGPKNLGLDRQAAEDAAKAALRLVGLTNHELYDRSPFELSGGQKRRVAIAGVIAMRPELLILDEPTAGLDPRGKHGIMQLIKDIKTAHGSTIIMISHNMDEVSESCDRVAVLDSAKLAGIYTPQELFRQHRLIHGLRLELPSVAELVETLKQGGINLPDGIIRELELEDALLSRFKEDEWPI